MSACFAVADLSASVIVLGAFAGLAVLAGLLHLVGVLDWALQHLGALAKRIVTGGFSWWRRWLAWAPWPVLLFLIAALHVVAWSAAAQHSIILSAGALLLWVGVTACLAYVYIDLERYEVGRGHKVLHNPAKGQEIAQNLAHYGHRAGMPLLILATASAISGFALLNQGLYYSVGADWYMIGGSRHDVLDVPAPAPGRAPTYTDFLAYSLLGIFRLVDLVDAANTYNLVQLTYVHQMRWPAATLLLLFKTFFTLVLWQQIFTVVRRIFVLGETIQDIWNPHEPIHERAQASLGQFGLAASAPLLHSLRQTEVLTISQRQRLARLLASLGTPAIPLLGRRVTDTHPNVRAVAVGALGHLHAVEQLPRLLPLAKDRVDAVRLALVEALAVLCEPGPRHIHKRVLLRQAGAGRWGRLTSLLWRQRCDPVQMVVDLLAELCGDSAAEIRLQAAAALGRVGAAADGAIASLHSLLSDSEESVRAQAVETLGQIQNLAAPTLDAMAALLDDTSAAVRLSAVRALATAGAAAAPAVPRLVRMLQDRDDAIRHEAAETLKHIGALPESATPSLLAGLTSADNQVRAQTAEAIGTIGAPADEALPALIQALEDSNDRVRLRAVEALDKLAVAEAIPALRRALHDDDNRVSARAAHALGNMGPVGTEAVADLRAALDHINAEVRGQAAAALGKTLAAFEAPPAVRQACLEALQRRAHDPDAGVRNQVLEALLQFATVDREAILRHALTDADALVRRSAAEAFGRGDELDPASAAALIEAVGDPSDQVQAAAARALAKSPVLDLPLLSALCRLLEDASPLVQVSAMQTLARFGPLARAAGAPLLQLLQRADSSLREQALRALALIQAPQAREAFSAGLHDPDAGIRKFASAGLLKMPDEAAALLPALLEALRDPEPQVRSNVAQVLARFDPLPEEAVPLLQESAANPDDGLRLNVLRALKTQAGPLILHKLLEDPDAQVRLEAAAALIALDPQHAQAHDLLRRALLDPAVGLRKTVLRLLVTLGEHARAFQDECRHLLALEQEPEVRIQLALVLERTAATPLVSAP